MHGVITIERLDHETGEIKRVRVNNTITNGIYNKLLAMLGGALSSTSNYKVWLQVGTGTSTPLATDVSLQSPITPMKEMAASVSGHIVTFAAQLETNEANGFSLSEAGIVLTDNTGGPFDYTLIAHAIFSSMVKSVRYSFSFSWSISVQAA